MKSDRAVRCDLCGLPALHANALGCIDALQAVVAEHRRLLEMVAACPQPLCFDPSHDYGCDCVGERIRVVAEPRDAAR